MKITSIADADIQKQIGNQVQRYRQFHLLVDPKINDEFLFTRPVDYQSMLPIRDRQDTVSGDNECLQIYTINLQQVSLKEIINLLKDKESSVIGILFSSYSNKDIQKHISNAMFLQYEANKYFLRFYDPYVLRHLVTIFNKKQLNNLLGVIEYWYFGDNHQYCELQHKSNMVIADIDYKITYQQFNRLTIAQSYNYYEHVIVQRQNFPLTHFQCEKLKKLVEFAFLSTYHRPDKEKLEFLVNTIIIENNQYFDLFDYDQIHDVMNNKNILGVKQYIDQQGEGIIHGFIGKFT